MPSAESLVHELCSRIAPVTLPDRVNNAKDSFLALGGRLAAIQKQAKPVVHLKGMACFATDLPGSNQGSQELRGWLGDTGAFQRLSAHCDVKWLVADVGLSEDFSGNAFSQSILPRLLKRISAEPREALWEAIQEGVRLACRMKGRGTDAFGLCFLTSSVPVAGSLDEAVDRKAWAIAAATGFLLAAADLQTPIVISGAPAVSALKVARSLVPQVVDYVLLAQSSELGNSEIPLTPLLQWTMSDPLAVILGLDLCQSAAKLWES